MSPVSLTALADPIIAQVSAVVRSASSADVLGSHPCPGLSYEPRENSRPDASPRRIADHRGDARDAVGHHFRVLDEIGQAVDHVCHQDVVGH
jgi:hypothetical protein